MVSLTYGSYDRVDVRASGDFTLVDDKLFMRVAGVSKNRDGYVDGWTTAARTRVPASRRSGFRRAAASEPWVAFRTPPAA